MGGISTSVLRFGYLGTNNNLVGGAFAYTDGATGLPAGGGPFTGATHVPFAGIYVAATYGGLFVGGLLLTQYYQTDLSAPGASLGGQSIDAHGYSFSGAIEYYWQVPNSNLVVEPSAGIIISSVKVDPFDFVTAGTTWPDSGVTTMGGSITNRSDDRLSGTLYFNDIDRQRHWPHRSSYRSGDSGRSCALGAFCRDKRLA